MNKERREFIKTAALGTLGLALVGNELNERAEEAKGNVELQETLKHVDAVLKVAMRDGMDANLFVINVLLKRPLSLEGYKRMIDDAVEEVKAGADPFGETFWLDLARKKGMMPDPAPVPTPIPTPSSMQAKIDLIQKA